MTTQDEMNAGAGAPFDDILALISAIPPADDQARTWVRQQLGGASSGLKPLGRLDEAVAWLAAWRGGERMPTVDKPLVAVFVGTHQVAATIDAYAGEESDILAQARARVAMITDGPAAVRGIAAASGAAFKIFEMGTEVPASDMSIGPSLSERDCAASMAFGMEVVAEGADLIVLGNAGLGSVTAAAGIARGLYGGTSGYWAGGQGKRAEARIAIVEKTAKLHKDHLNRPLEVLRRFGGRDIAGMCGAILAARHQKVPVLLDGFVSCAAAAVLHRINPAALDHCLAAHQTLEPAHGALLDRIGKKPVLDFGVGIGDGSGAAMTLGVIKAAASGANTL